MRLFAAAAIGSALASCATLGTQCNAGPVQYLVGSAPDQSMEAELMRLTNSREVAWITQEHIVTTVRVPGRLSVETHDLGNGERISRIRCF